MKNAAAQPAKETPTREDRAAAALRENLRKRKQQAQARCCGETDTDTSTDKD